MPLVTLPYAARLATAFLLDQEEVTDLVGANIGTDIAATPEAGKGIVRLTSFPGRVIDSTSIYWLESTVIQFDCWGPGGNDRLNAHTIAETCRAALSQRFTGTQSFTLGTSAIEGVVTGVEVGGIADDSDDAYQPARPRSRFDAVITAHPTPAA